MLALQPEFEPQRLIDVVLADEEVVQSIILSVRRGEVDGFNDLGRFRRRSHRGSRSEEQTLQYLGRSLEELGFGWEEETNQCRFFNRFRYGWPIRVLHSRASLNPCGTSFRIGRKGERTQELLNENRQGQLFEYVNSTSVTPASCVEQVYNLWILADSPLGGNLRVFMAYPRELQRNRGENWQTMTLFCDHVRLLWEGSLFDGESPIVERPEAMPVEDDLVRDRDEDLNARPELDLVQDREDVKRDQDEVA
jgi:hypothetical protein